MSLLRDLDAFYVEDRRCGELDSGVESECVCMKCSCGAVLGRNVARRATHDHRLAVRAEHLLARVRVNEFAVILGLGPRPWP